MTLTELGIVLSSAVIAAGVALAFALLLPRLRRKNIKPFQIPTASFDELSPNDLRHLGDICAQCAPNLSWILDDAGNVLWKNAKAQNVSDTIYTALIEKSQRMQSMSEKADGELEWRHEINAGPKDQAIFDVVTTLDGTLRIHHAVNVTPLVKAETEQRRFVQTLSKTFAQIPIGLAVFDIDGKLALFNPALVNLTGLSAPMLTKKPDFLSFFDGLRENRRMPEPKNMGSWRDQITEVVRAAEGGLFQESWSLASGQTLQITGQPHPDGAVAFLIEDVSAEMTLTRHMRAESDMYQSALDVLEDAMIVLSDDGVVFCSNTAFKTKWNLDTDTSFAECNAYTVVESLEATIRKDQNWITLKSHLLSRGMRREAVHDVRQTNGHPLRIRSHPIAGGATLIRFETLAHSIQRDEQIAI